MAVRDMVIDNLIFEVGRLPESVGIWIPFAI